MRRTAAPSFTQAASVVTTISGTENAQGAGIWAIWVRASGWNRTTAEARDAWAVATHSDPAASAIGPAPAVATWARSVPMDVSIAVTSFVPSARVRDTYRVPSLDSASPASDSTSWTANQPG